MQPNFDVMLKSLTTDDCPPSPCRSQPSDIQNGRVHGSTGGRWSDFHQVSEGRLDLRGGNPYCHKR